jgi:hypothetical protein
MKSRTLIEVRQSPGLKPRHGSWSLFASISFLRAALPFMAISPSFGACHRIVLLSYPSRAAPAGRIDLNQRTIEKLHASDWPAY